MYDLAITISGLCLVELKADREDLTANEATVWIPPAKGHVPRLVFRHADLTGGFKDIQLDRFYGPSGEDLLALPLKNRKGEFEINTDSTKIGMSWAPKKPNRPIPEGVMDWLIDCKDLGLKIGKFSKMISKISLPPGRLGSKNIIFNQGGTEILLWGYKGREVQRHALADDILLKTPIKDRAITFKWRDAGVEKYLEFFPQDERTLELCISHDDATVSSYELAVGDNPHEHLRYLAEAFSQKGSDLNLPFEIHDQLTGGRICTQAVYFAGRQ